VPELKNIRFRFVAFAFLLCNFVVLLLDFLIPIKITIPFWGFYLIEIPFCFLILFLAFPKYDLKPLLKIAPAFIAFLALSFVLHGFLPFSAQHKLISYSVLELNLQMELTINLIAVLSLHLLTIFLFASEALRETKDKDLYYEASPGDSLQYQKQTAEPNLQEQQTQSLLEDDYEEDTDIREDINSLFDLYIDDVNLEDDSQELINHLEEILINNLHEGITGVMCLGPNAEELHSEIFHWQGFAKQQLLDLFKRNNEISLNLDEGNLCQLLFSDTQYWYLVAKFRGNYLLLQTTESQPDLLVENGFYLIQAFKEFAKKV